VASGFHQWIIFLPTIAGGL